jgi:hypothetical protein
MTYFSNDDDDCFSLFSSQKEHLDIKLNHLVKICSSYEYESILSAGLFDSGAYHGHW